MTFIPLEEIRETKRSNILIVGDYPDETALQKGEQFSLHAKSAMTTCLHMGGLVSSEAEFANVIFDRTNNAAYWNRDSKRPKATADLEYREAFVNLLNRVQPNIVVALGDFVFYWLTGHLQLQKRRGYLWPCRFDPTLKVLGTFHPRETIWMNQIWRYYIAHDLMKARRHSLVREFQFQECDIIIPQVAGQAFSLIDHIEKLEKPTGFDIEVSNFHTSCIALCAEPPRTISIPFDSRWTEQEEVMLWRAMDRLCRNKKVTKILQNGIFDIQFLFRELGILTEGYEDIMVAHSLLYPDFQKSLNFIGSIHTDMPYWKDMVKWQSLKEDA